MKVQLLVSEWCTPCRDAEEVWRRIAQRKHIAFEVLDVGQPEGREIVARLGVRTVPSTVIDDTLKHLGVPTPQEADTLTAGAPDRQAKSSEHYVGLTLEATSAWAIVAAAFYLVLAGAALVLGDGIAGDAPWRAPAVHIYGLGFLVFFVFGLGEHLLPRFTGAPIRGGGVAWLQQALAHGGTILLSLGFLLAARPLAITGGVLAWSAFALFACRLAPVLRARNVDAQL
ncbi:MAG: thioredoxin family protein [Burkholderiales bacterium]|nr:thioredoxin family protein [Burkholderiales bacterium]